MIRRSIRGARGIALLIVLVVLVLIATLATEIAVTAKTHHTLSEHSMDELLLRTTVDGRIEILKSALTYEASRGLGYDCEAGTWAWHNHDKLSSWGERGTSTYSDPSGDTKGDIAFKNTDVQVTAWAEDERAKINLRGLMKPEESDVFKNTRDALVRLIDIYRDKWSSLDLSEGDAKDMVDDLVRWLQAESDTDDNPMPAVKPNRGRLQSIDDLLRVPGGHWTPERLYDVKDPDVTDDDVGSSRTVQQTNNATTGTDESAWERSNGIAGLARFLTVYAETTTADPPMRINVNTASVTVLRALFDAVDDDLAQKIADFRRQGVDDATGTGTGTSGTTSGTQGTTGTTGGSGTNSTDPTQNYFKAKADLASGKIEGMEKDLAKYPRLNYFADTTSVVYSLRVIAKVVRGGSGGSSTDAASTDDSAEPKQVDAVCDYRMVVQRTTAGFITILCERRTDPLFDTK
jgi:type II secretory pathway component PulK